MSDTDYPSTARTSPTRSRERVHYDRELVHGILDQSCVCHLGFVREGLPVVLPTLYTRLGEVLYLHGSTGAAALRAAQRPGGLAVCVTVTLVDALVLARSGMHHSVNYRSVVAHGAARPVTDPAEQKRVLNALVDQVLPGRAADTRPPDARELAATAVLALDLCEVSAKVRTGGPADDPGDVPLPHWSGTVPLHTRYGEPVPAGDLDPAIPVPDYLRDALGAPARH